MEFLLGGLLSATLLVLIFMGLKKIEDKSREKGVHCITTLFFVHIIGPCLIPVLILLLVAAVGGIALWLIGVR